MNCGFCVWIASGLDATLNATRTGQRETENWLNKKPKLKPKPKLKFKNTTLKTIVKRTRERESECGRERNTHREWKRAHPHAGLGCDSAREKEGERTSACACWGSCCAAALLIGSTAPFRFLRICFCFCLRCRYCRCLSRVALTAAAGLSDEKEREREREKCLAECSRARRMLER